MAEARSTTPGWRDRANVDWEAWEILCCPKRGTPMDTVGPLAQACTGT